MQYTVPGCQGARDRQNKRKNKLEEYRSLNIEFVSMSTTNNNSIEQALYHHVALVKIGDKIQDIRQELNMSY